MALLINDTVPMDSVVAPQVCFQHIHDHSLPTQGLGEAGAGGRKGTLTNQTNHLCLLVKAFGQPLGFLQSKTD